MDIKKELLTNQTVLLLMPSVEYNDIIIDTMKNLSGKSVVYVTLNKTFDSLTELFKKSKINLKNVVFIDAISKTLKKVPSQAESVFYCSSPGALTELSLVINKFLKHDFDYLIFDSITNLSVYQKKAAISKFISSLINKVKAGKTKAVFYSLGGKDDISKQVSIYADKVVDAGKQTKVKKT